MKRFLVTNKLGEKVVVTLDDADAYVMRSLRWGHRLNSSQRREVSAQTSTHERTELGRYLMGAKRGEWVEYQNLNHLDFRRANMHLRRPEQQRRLAA